MPRLVVEKGKDKGKTLALRENQIYLIGRDLKTSLRLRDLGASRRHLKVTMSRGTVKIEDLDSSNGTTVNGERIKSHDLRPGDKIQIGDTLIFFLEDESTDEAAIPGKETASLAVPASGTVDKTRKGELSGLELGGYRLGRLLGRGGMGTVYEAVQISLERRVAFKVLAAEYASDGQFVDRFMAEARAAGQLNHPNIVQVYDVGTATATAGFRGPKDVRFYSMEYMSQGSVEDLLRKEGRLPVERALPIVFDAARGLEYAERHGVVHRDIKPDNLMISEDGVVKIGDLGIATRRRAEGEASTEDGVSGSPHYMAPEQAMGRSIDHRADLYALGISLYQIVSGDTPYEGASAREVILKHLNEAPPPLAAKVPGLAPEIVSLVERLMAKDPEQRLPSASVLLQELVPLVRKFPVSESSRTRIDGVIAQRTELQVQATPRGTDQVPMTDFQAALAGSPLALAETEARVPPAKPGEPPARRLIPVSKAALVRAAIVLGSLCLGVLAFQIVRHVRQNAIAAHDERSKRLEAARGLLARDVYACESLAKALALEFQQAGAREDARAAQDLVQDAGKKIVEDEEKARTDKATQAYGEAERQFKEAQRAPDDPEGIARYKLAADLFGKVAQAFDGTRPGEQAAAQRDASLRYAREAEVARDARLAREAAAKDQLLHRTQPAFDGLLEKQDFVGARKVVEGFDGVHGTTDLGKTAVAAMRAALLAKARSVFESARKKAHDEAKQGHWNDAKSTLKWFRQEAEGIEELVAAVDNELANLAATEKTPGNQEQVRADLDREKALESDARDPLTQRRFEDAAHVFDLGLEKVKTTAVRDRLAIRADRLHEAAAGLTRLIDYIRDRKEHSGVGRHEDVGGAATVLYQAYDADASRIRFRSTRDATKTLDVSMAQFTPEELHTWVLEASVPPAGLIHGAALALALGDRDLAARDLRELAVADLTEEQRGVLKRLTDWQEESK